MACWQLGIAMCSLGLLLLGAHGCGNDNRATVTGRVALAGKPLVRGNVVFHSLGEQPTANGIIQPSGQYALTTGRSEGLAPGEYRVTVQSREPVILPTDNRSGPTPGKRITPEIYGDVRTTPLRYIVEADSNVIDIELEPQEP